MSKYNRVFGFQDDEWAKGLRAWMEKRPPQHPWQMAIVEIANPADVWRRAGFWEWMSQMADDLELGFYGHFSLGLALVIPGTCHLKEHV